MRAKPAVLLAAMAMLLGGLTVAPSAIAVASSPVPLTLSQGQAFKILGYWCGGIKEQAYATGFDPATGFPAGDVYMQTTCNGSGRGGHSVLIKAWATVIWDFTGVMVTAAKLAAPPTVNSTFSAYDANQNEIYSSGTTAFLQLAPGYIPVPRLLSMTAGQGTAAGGTSVIIYGTGFTGATSVTFGSVSAVFTVVNDDEITTTSPVESNVTQTVPVTVTTGGGPNVAGSQSQFTFYAVPALTGLSPRQGPVTGGTVVTITGSGFTDATSVLFDGIWAQFAVVDDHTITATSPAGENPDDISVDVTTPGGVTKNGSASRFTYTAPVVPLPTISGIKPAAGPRTGGTKVTITGTNLSGVTAVMFGAKRSKSITPVSDTSVIARSPAGSGVVSIRVTTGYGTSRTFRADKFTYKRR